MPEEPPIFHAWDQPPEDESLLTPEEREQLKRRRQGERDRLAAERQAKLRGAITTISLLLIGFYALGVMLIELSFILVPLVFSRFIVYIFAPLIKAMTVWRGRKTGVPQWAAVLACLLLIFIFMGLLLLIIGYTVQGIIADAGLYVEGFNDLFSSLFSLAEQFGYTRDQLLGMLPNIDVGGLAITILSTMFDLVPQIMLVLLIVVYMLLGIDISVNNKRSKLEELIDGQIRSYITIHGLISIVIGFGTGGVLFLWGVDLVPFFGLMAFVLNFIPNVGSVIAVLLPMPFVLLNPDIALWKFPAIGLSLTALHFVVGQVIEPQILGGHMEIPPITVIICLLFWASLWGLVGAVLSVPLTTSIKVYLENIDHPATKALAGMIVGDFSVFDTTAHADYDCDDENDENDEKKETDDKDTLAEERTPILLREA